MPTCFVIMPLTTPPDAVGDYNGDGDHFIHVLEHLFAPAVKRAGYDLVEPITRGSDVIHADIIKNLERAELVLCDMSRLNANVFFELGIRTALDRPSAIVVDDCTPTVPFDTGIINHLQYDSALSPWKLEEEIEALGKHLADTAAGAESRSSLWRYFGLTQRAEPPELGDPTQGKLDLLLERVQDLGPRPEVRDGSSSPHRSQGDHQALFAQVDGIMRATDTSLVRLRTRGDEEAILEVEDPDALSTAQTLAIHKAANQHGYTMKISGSPLVE